MPLAPATNVPHTLIAEVQGLEGTEAWIDLTQPRDRLTLWVVAHPQRMALQLDLAGVLALQQLLGEAAETMRAG